MIIEELPGRRVVDLQKNTDEASGCKMGECAVTDVLTAQLGFKWA